MSRIPSLYLMLTLMATLLVLGAQSPALAADDLELGRALYQAGEQRDMAMKTMLQDCLYHPNAHIRRIAAHALGKLGCSDTCHCLMSLAEDPGQPLMVRCEAIKTLGRLGSQDARPVISVMCCHQSPVLRAAASKSLRLLGNQEAS